MSLKSKTEFDLNIGQVINEKENRNKGSESSLIKDFLISLVKAI